MLGETVRFRLTNVLNEHTASLDSARGVRYKDAS